MILTLIQLNL